MLGLAAVAETTNSGAIPVWLGAVGALFVIAAALGAAVAVYRTNLQGTSLREAEHTIGRLRGEIGDYQRRETELEGDVRVLHEKDASAQARIRVLEDLLTKRKDDAEIRAEIAHLTQLFDDGIKTELQKLRRILEGTPGAQPNTFGA